DGSGQRLALVIDLPMNQEAVSRLREDTGIEVRAISPYLGSPTPAPARHGMRPMALVESSMTDRLVPPWVVFTEYADWATGRRGAAALRIGMSIADIYRRLSPREVLGRDFFALIVLIIAALFLIIQFFALVVGFALAQSITGSVHQLF